MKSYDVIVAGVGAMGSAACAEISRRGKRVLGLEQFDIPHSQGSSHGETRIIRLAYYEDSSYVTLMRRSYELWEELQGWYGEQLLFITGSIDAGPLDGWVFSGSLRSCEDHGLDHQVLTSRELTARFPGYRLPEDTLALLQPRGGFVTPESSIVAQVMRAHSLGAEIHAREQILEITTTSYGFSVRTTRDSYEAERLVVAAGAWVGDLVPELASVAIPERQVLGWFQPPLPDRFQPATFPVFNLEAEDDRYYGFPVFGIPGFKIGRYRHLGEQGHPSEIEREPDEKDEAILREAVARYFPDANGPTMSLHTCMFTNAPDGHFIVDFARELGGAVIASPCSGHGFKFAPVIGEIVAQLAVEGHTSHDIGLFGLGRFL